MPGLQQQQNTHRTPAIPQSPFLLTRQQAQGNNFPFSAGGGGVLGQNGASKLPFHMSPNPPTASTASVSSMSEIVFDLNEFPVPGSLGQTNNNANTSSAVNIDPLLTSSAPTLSGGNGPQVTQPQPLKPQHLTVPCGVLLLGVSLNVSNRNNHIQQPSHTLTMQGLLP